MPSEQLHLEPYSLLLTMAQADPALRSGVTRDQLQICIGTQHSRRTHPSDALEQRWEAACAANPRLFDATKFRLASIDWGECGGGVTVSLGLTSYKEYLGTNRLPPQAYAALAAEGEASHGNAGAFFSNALGCEALLLTSDGLVTLLRRSAHVATHVGLYNGPSGHPEPERARIGTAELAEMSAAGLASAGSASAGLASAGLASAGLASAGSASAGSAAAISAASISASSSSLVARAAAELFDSIVQETHEETGIPLEMLGEPRLIGCMADSVGKPDLLFVLTTSLDAAAVRTQFAAGATEGWESDRIAFHAHADLIGEHPRSGIALTAVTRAAVECYGLLAQPGVGVSV